MTTIADVAQAAGVSISTVSYVMSGKRTISQETRERVERAMADLSYSPQASARSLASRSTSVLGLQAPIRAGVDVHVVMQIVAGALKEARAHHHDILLLTSDDAAGVERAARAGMVDGVLILDVETSDPRVGALAELSIPAVLIGLPDAADDLVCVDFDFEAAGRLAAQRLAERGHQSVALLGAPPQVQARHTSYSDRLMRGFLAASEAAGLTARALPCPSGPGATEVVDAVLAESPDTTALFVHNEAALPFIAARLMGAADTGPVEILALSPAELALHVPGVSDVIDLPAETLGARGARALLDAIGGTRGPGAELIAPRFADPTG
ncbi:LacI family DNA-binding transcriptional regulator [Microbacterium sp. KSW4-11]|uniref:LacI family transcriptional regulator n=2 Tax=Microbacterium TaxID=33882 RepID=A0A177K6A4_9MICO|nr:MULTISPECIES: LacI family DNA-binding transcriptional regulator [Microbacterium]MDT3315803.1 LacI family DNA-binding transcriptional regulator [Microbacterium sp. KSW4-11]OAH48939.1 LacI family transcriptional regulator [Microbacterium oleivorans]